MSSTLTQSQLCTATPISSLCSVFTSHLISPAAFVSRHICFKWNFAQVNAILEFFCCYIQKVILWSSLQYKVLYYTSIFNINAQWKGKISYTKRPSFHSSQKGVKFCFTKTLPDLRARQRGGGCLERWRAWTPLQNMLHTTKKPSVIFIPL